MIVTYTPGAMKRFRRTPWRFQQTVETPLEDLDRFITTIFAAYTRIDYATITIDQVVFDAESLAALFSTSSSTPLARDSSITARTPEDAAALLKAALADWVDFVFISTPKPFVIYADHDEWITFYANTKANLNQVIRPLAARGYKLVENWTREL